MGHKPIRGTFNVAITAEKGTVTIRNSNVIELYFIEDVFSYAMVGKLTFKDDIGLVEYGPLTGTELIQIEYVYGETKKTIEFKIFKVQNIKQLTSAGTGSLYYIELILVQKLFENLNYYKFSYGWKDKNISTIVADITDNMLNIKKRGYNEPLTEKLDFFYMPYWTPYTALNWLFKRTKGKISQQPGVVCFQSTKPEQGPDFNIASLEYLFENVPDLIISDDGGSDKGEYYNEDKGAAYASKILSWEVLGTDRWSLKNLAGAKNILFNPEKKIFVEKENNFSQMKSKQTIFGQKMLCGDISSVDIDYINHGEQCDKQAQLIWKNKWHKTYATQQIINLEVTGHPKRHCASVIKLIWSSFDKDEIMNKNISGNYFIKGITHYFNPKSNPSFRQKLICIKNGFLMNDNKLLEKASKIR